MKTPVRITALSQPEAASAKNLIAVAFPKSPSKSYEMVVDLAKKALSYDEVTLGNKMFHCAVFGKDKSQASNAIIVIDAVKDWKQTRIFVRGRILERHYNVVETLRCYLDSLESLDPKAYCNFVYTDLADEFSLFNIPVKGTYFVPCRKLEGFMREIVRYPIGGPEADIQAAAIRRGCFWCPNFNPKGFRQIKGEACRLKD
jgi:hypothetical protein